MTKALASLRKMQTRLGDVVEYQLNTDAGVWDLNDMIGSRLNLQFTGKINCVACNKFIQKTYGGGHCFDCLQTLASCDMCQVKPELCHFDRGTCREPEWGRTYCMIPHKVYMARSSGVKVGITREDPVETRWMDQGAVEAMVIAEVPDRKTSGLMEVAIANHIQDKTDFRKMLRGEVSAELLEDVYRQVVEFVPVALRGYLLEKREQVHIKYPLKTPPEKIKVAKFDTQAQLNGVLKGIKGQYLVFDEFVFNVKGHAGYETEIEAVAAGESGDEEEQELSLFDLM